MAALVALVVHLHAAQLPRPDPHPRGETESRSVNSDPSIAAIMSLCPCLIKYKLVASV